MVALRSARRHVRADNHPIHISKATHFIFAIFMLHYHQSKILRQGFHQYAGSLQVGTDHLMSPPLMRHFMRRHIENIIDIVFIAQISDESYRF